MPRWGVGRVGVFFCVCFFSHFFSNILYFHFLKRFIYSSIVLFFCFSTFGEDIKFTFLVLLGCICLERKEGLKAGPASSTFRQC